MLRAATVIGEAALRTPFTVTTSVPVPNGVFEGRRPTICPDETKNSKTSVVVPATVTCTEVDAKLAGSGKPSACVSVAGPIFVP